MLGKDQIKVLSKEDFRKFCDKCQCEEAGGRRFSAADVKALSGASSLNVHTGQDPGDM